MCCASILYAYACMGYMQVHIYMHCACVSHAAQSVLPGPARGVHQGETDPPQTGPCHGRKVHPLTLTSSFHLITCLDTLQARWLAGQYQSLTLGAHAQRGLQ